MNNLQTGNRVTGFAGKQVGTLKHIDREGNCYIEADNGDTYSSIPVSELSKIMEE